METQNAIQLDKESVREGHILKVYNSNKPKFSNANKSYYCIWVEQAGKEFPLLFSQAEINSAKYRASKNLEDIPKKSLIANWID